MPNFAATLKTEMARLARKEVRAQVDPLRKLATAQRKEIAELRRQVALLARLSKKATKNTSRVAQEAGATAATRFSAKGMRSLRARLGLSAADFGKLAGASGQSIYGWETGKTFPREPQRTALASLRSMGKKEALARLEHHNAR